MSKLNVEDLNALFDKCLFDEPAEDMSEEDVKKYREECVSRAKIVKGIVRNFAFDPKKLEARKEEISAMLAELPDEFMKSKGGGWSFLNACMDKHGNHWAEHSGMEALMCLGEAVGLVSYPMPRDIWSGLPGGMPYFTVNL